MPADRADELIRTLGMRPHPEGGHFVETFRSPIIVPGPNGDRAASTAILFLLRAGEVSRWHRVAADEAWHWYEGDQLELLTSGGPDGDPLRRHRLGRIGQGGVPQAVVPAGMWQAARPCGAYALVGCTVAPGFDFADFALLDPAGADAAWFRGQADPRLVDGPACQPDADI